MNQQEKIHWNVEGMDCATCALTVNSYLKKQGGQDVKVNFATGDVSFILQDNSALQKMVDGVTRMGYKVVPGNGVPGHVHSYFWWWVSVL